MGYPLRAFQGGVFDGRYVYFAPRAAYRDEPNAWFLRFDTRASFADPKAWTSLDTGAVGLSTMTFNGMAFDGRYVYYVPSYASQPEPAVPAPSGQIARYDTLGAFSDPASWSQTTVANPPYAGAVFDGNFLYLVPANLGSVVARLDVRADFKTNSSWSYFDVWPVKLGARGFVGGVFDGRYLYLVPYINDSATTSGIVVRFDTTADFASRASWSSFDMTTVHPNAKGFSGGIFDGRYVYFVKAAFGSGETGPVVVPRYDTQGAFDAAAAWSTFDLTAVTSRQGLSSGGFDGRFVYLFKGVTEAIRYDTWSPFGSTSSWSGYDLGDALKYTGPPRGSVFDGRYLYLVPGRNYFEHTGDPVNPIVPGANSYAIRFETRDDTAILSLPQFHGSFF